MHYNSCTKPSSNCLEMLLSINAIYGDFLQVVNIYRFHNTGFERKSLTRNTSTLWIDRAPNALVETRLVCQGWFVCSA